MTSVSRTDCGTPPASRSMEPIIETDLAMMEPITEIDTSVYRFIYLYTVKTYEAATHR